MSYVRQPLLSPEVEAQLKDELSQLWLMGMKGKDIAQELQFGVEGTDYEKLKPHYVYYYRQKFAENDPDLFPCRIKPPFAKNESRYKHSPEELGIIEPEKFIETLDEKLPLTNSFYSKRARSFLIVLFYTPLRSSEIYERTINDFEITKTKITIHLLRKKKRRKGKQKDEPIDIPRVFPLVDEVVDWLEGEEWKKEKVNKKGELTFNWRPWEISHDTARNYVKEVFENAYPHWFRFNFLTTEANYPEITIAELKSKSRLTLSALEKYVMAPKVVEQQLDRRRIKRFKDKGLIE